MSYSGVDIPVSQNGRHFFEIEQLPKDDPTVLKLTYYSRGSEEYEKDIYHWATSSSQDCQFTVQPETVKDVSDIFEKIVKERKPFAVKSGGHTANPGFSSSSNLLISMKRFNQVDYDPNSQTAVIGAGQVWDNVYARLAQYHVTVVGARVTNIGVAGFILGGGYSWHTNQYGLAIDTVTAFELVKPDGTIANVTERTDPELFFALKGGGNNFGIVTKFTMKTFPLGKEGKVWGGSILLADLQDNPSNAEKMKKLFFAAQEFMDTLQDKKAAILVSLASVPSMKILNFMAFYDGPSPPAGIFDAFKEIAPEECRELWITRDYLDLIKNLIHYEYTSDFRAGWHTVPLSCCKTELLQVIWDENEKWSSNPPKDIQMFSLSLEPILPDILSHSRSPSAYPPDRSIAFSPFLVCASWKDPNADANLQKFVKEVALQIKNKAEENGIQIGSCYPNYAIFDTPLTEMYGTNVEKLKMIKERVDPSNVMGLAGGFKF